MTRTELIAALKKQTFKQVEVYEPLDGAVHRIVFLRYQIQVLRPCITVEISWSLQISGYAFCNLMR